MEIESSILTFLPLQILSDLVQGELMQLGSKETENERFAHYFMKTFRKTASLIANALKAVSLFTIHLFNILVALVESLDQIKAIENKTIYAIFSIFRPHNCPERTNT